jgi:spermidine synthase
MSKEIVLGHIKEDHMEKAFTAAENKNFEMSRYIDLNLYHAVERSHSFYVEMSEEIQKQISSFHQINSGNLRALEIGAGTGLFTNEMLKNDFLEIDALDLDYDCLEILENHVGEKVNCIHGDAVEYCNEGAYDLIVSVFAHDHIHYDKRFDFAKNIRKNLRRDGIYILGGEFLPYFETNDERKESLYRYHGYIVDQALRHGHYALAQIEINALESGIQMIGDFKRHTDMFENEMASSQLELLHKIKIGPQGLNGIGGIYVYIYKK